MPDAVPAFLQPSINVLNLGKPQFPGDPSKAPKLSVAQALSWVPWSEMHSQGC